MDTVPMEGEQEAEEELLHGIGFNCQCTFVRLC
jgi:hypothetical protein